MKRKVLLTVFGFFGIFITLFFVQQSLQSTLTAPITTPLTSATAPSNTALNNTTAPSSQTNKNTAASVPQHTATPPISLADHETQVLSDFKTWLNSKNKHSTVAEWEQQGQDLAQQRQTIMQTLMQTQPQQALAQSVTFQQYAALPDSIKNLVEQPFSKQVELVVLPNETRNKNFKEAHQDGNSSYIKFDQQRLQVYRYGQRNTVLSKQNLAVQGIMLGKEAVIYDQALIPIAPADAVYIQQHFSEPNQNPNANKTDFYTGKPIQGDAVLALAGGKILPFASSKNLQQLNTQLARLEQINHPQSTARVLEKYKQASNSNTSQSITEPLSQHLEKLLAKGSDWTTTVKKVLLIRVITADASGTAISQAALHTALTNSSDLIKKISHNKTSLDVTVSSQSFILSKTTAIYSLKGGAGDLLTEAKTLFSTANSGVDLDIYDVVGVHIGGEGLSVKWAGLASVGGGDYWLNNTIGLGTVTHEFGHNYGLSHANFWETNNASVVGTGSNEEYGDIFDIMGDGNAPEGYFHPQALAKLTWLEASTGWTDITTSGKYRISRFDHESATGLRGLRIARNGGASDGYYWLGYRQNFDNNNYLENGAYLIWEQADEGKSWLIDTTPASFADKNDDKNDAGIVLGQTYSDIDTNIHITTLAKGGTAPNEWLDIQVNMDNTANNAAPTVSLTLPTTLTARTPLTFTANASDSNGDNLSYQWDFGDGVIHPSSANVTHTWTVGGTYTVKITVSDMKGKTATAQETITVADPLTQWTQRTSNTTQNLHDIASNGTMLLAVGKPILSSSDGQTWTQLKDKIGTNVILNSIVYSGSQWVAVGKDYDFSIEKWIGIIYTSSDASTWVERYKGDNELNKIAVGNNTLVAVGDSGTILSSADGITWTTKSSPTSTSLRGIAFGDNTFVIVGSQYYSVSNGGTSVVLTSPDGNTWTDRSANASLGMGARYVDFVNDRFLASGFVTKIANSIDKGISFNTTRNDYEEIATFSYGNGIYFAAGRNISNNDADIDRISIDGVNWSVLTTINQDDRNDSIFFKNTFITVGDNGSIRQSDAVTTPVTIVDADNDTIADANDNCPNIANTNQADLDKDNVGDVCDTDRDGDSVANDQDAFPDNAAESVDTDSDGVGDKSDNCPNIANTDQADDDNDNIGNVCEPVVTDKDNDGILDSNDNCPNISNADQSNQDGDNLGDVCDTDRDGDGVANDQDAFPDLKTESVDTDSDTIGDNSDNCPNDANTQQTDTDKDGVGDACESSTNTSIQKPFPQHTNYAANTIRPTNFTQTEQDKHVSDFYDYWKQNYLKEAGKNSANKSLYRIAFAKSGGNVNVTVSEGQGYGMEITALMAGYDANAQMYFDGLWHFVRQYPSGIDNRLMSWKITNSVISDGNDSAFDGDVDIAYGLLLADAQWGSAGDINYKAEAITVIQGILASTIGASSRLPMLGDWVDDNGTKYNQYTPRSSDFMPAHFRSFARVTGDSTWDTVVTNSQAAIDAVQAISSNTTGLLPDFIVDCNPVSNCKPSNGQFLESSNDEFYYYNAGRDPLRIGLDALLNGDAKSHTQVKKILDWLKSVTNGKASNIKSGYQLNGTVIGDYSSSFFTAPFGVAAMLDPNQQNFLNDIYNQVYNKQEDYYEDSVNLLSLLVMTGNYWEAVPADKNTDTDGDGINDSNDNCPTISNANQADDDNDGVGNACETSAVDTDNDGIADALDLDDDNDAMPDTWEISKGLNSLDASDAKLDRDNNGINNINEYFQSLTTIWRPTPNTTWQWQLTGTIDTSLAVAMYDIDLFDTPKATIELLQSQGKKVICYFSAGSYENWRDDKAQFPAEVLGSVLDDHPNEKWLDIRAIDKLAPVMQARMDLAVSKGCDGIEPDNVDAYTNSSSGFPLQATDQLAYNQWLAIEAHKRGLSIGLKNDLEQIPALLQYFDFAVNEQCYQYNECDLLKPFISANKAVFGVEYQGKTEDFCPLANTAQFSWLVKTTDLDAQRTACTNTALPDSDGDGLVDVNDNCYAIANADQADLDGDGIGNVCDKDRDGDGIDNDQDPLPDDATVDSDGDGFGDSVDVFPQDPTEWLDTDNDGIGDNADQFPNDPDKSKDSDNDGIDDSSDNCPLNSNAEQKDKDNNGKGDVCDITTDHNASSAELTPIIDIYDDWGTGFCADVVVRNTTSAIVDWTAKFKPDATITSVWGALISVPNSDGLVTAEGVNYNNTLGSQTSTHFGYCAKRTLDTSVIEPLSAEVEYPNSEDDWSWEGGYCATVKVKNDQDHVVDWTTSFTLPSERQGTITSFWDGTYTLEGNTLTVAGVSWNNWLLPDQFTTFGFCVNTDSGSGSGDTTPPEVTAPDALTGDKALKSKTFLTAFRLAQLGTATAEDETDGAVTARILSVNGDDIRLKNNKILLQSGRHLIVWYAEDQAGNRGIAQQYVDVLPRANFVVNQSSSEGKTVTVEAWLNGDAPSYPVEIPFTLDSSSTADSDDYQISSHTISIDQLQAGDNQENPHGTVTVNLVDDADELESTETIVFKMDKDKLKNAVAGKKRRHKIKILNENAAPKAKLKVSQGTKKGRKVEQSNVNVTIRAEAKDPNGDPLSYDWSKTPQALVDIPESPDDPATFVFNPSSVALGKYKIQVAISDGKKTINKKKRIKVIAATTISNTEDTDNDGILDKNEAGDLNENGIPDYLEAPHDEHELPSDADGSTFLSGEPGTELGLGSIAFDSDSNSCTITEEQIQAYLAAQGLPTYQTDNGFKADKIFDYEIGSLEDVGSTSQIVLSLASPLTAQSVIRKYSITQGTWSAFSEDANNKLESLINTEGNCPDDEDTIWSNGLVVGGTCLRLTIEDGGPNDADGEANGEIDDPVAITTQQSTGGGSTGGGSTGGGSTTTPVVIVESNHINYFKLAIAQPLDVSASVDYTTRDGTAIAGQDYIATKGTAVIPAGKTQVLIPVEILADSTNETDEHFSLVLSNPIGGIFPIGTTVMSVSHTIIDGSSVNESFYEGSTNHKNYFKLELNQVMETDASIAYTTRDGTAIAGQDYIATTGTATIKAGQTRLLIPVEIIADSIAEADETFSLVITNPTGGVFPAGTTEIVSTHTIVNDDQ